MAPQNPPAWLDEVLAAADAIGELPPEEIAFTRLDQVYSWAAFTHQGR